jgi:hypothetical protein
MNNTIIKAQINNHICYAVNCNRKATNVIELDVGKFGLIPILLCNNCISKFTKKEVLK